MRGLKKVFNSLTVQTYQTNIKEAFKVFDWLSMTFLASFPKTETLAMENYFPKVINWSKQERECLGNNIPLPDTELSQ